MITTDDIWLIALVLDQKFTRFSMESPDVIRLASQLCTRRIDVLIHFVIVFKSALIVWFLRWSVRQELSLLFEVRTYNLVGSFELVFQGVLVLRELLVQGVLVLKINVVLLVGGLHFSLEKLLLCRERALQNSMVF